MSITAKTIPARSEHAVFRVVDEETVIVQPKDGMVTVISVTGSRIWELADGTRSVGQMADVLAGEYDVAGETAKHDIIRFVEDMQDKGLMKEHL